MNHLLRQSTSSRNFVLGCAFGSFATFVVTKQRSRFTFESSAICEGSESKCPYKSPATPKKSECPYATNDTDSSNKVFNVYAQEIDPRNRVPYNVNQLPLEDQEKVLSAQRMKSSIPKSGGKDGETWTYPSPQIFYNALKRKNKADDVNVDDMNAVVAVHNSMNEQTWQKLLCWERLNHPEDMGNLKLVRFMGRPHDLTPKARVLSTVGARPKPFDRHDWYITRDGGKTEVRYVIDYYYDEVDTKSGNTRLPGAKESRIIHVDVRPALDSFEALKDRVYMAMPWNSDDILRTTPETVFEKTETILRGENEDEEEFEQRKQFASTNRTIEKECRSFMKAYQQCNDNESEEAMMAMMGLKLCMAQHVCEKGLVEQFMEDESEDSLAKISTCLEGWEESARRFM